MSNKNVPRHLKIFVAWPSDVETERNRAEQVIQTLHQVYLPRNCYIEMLDWRKNVPPGAGNPEDVILHATEPESWDAFLGILWKRFGKPPGRKNPKTGKPYASGFETEYERAHNLWEEKERPYIMIYRCTQTIPHDADVKQLSRVQQFFKGIEKRYEVLYKRYDSPDDFAKQLTADLADVIEKILQRGLKKRKSSFPYSRTFEDIAEKTDFSNREYELGKIQSLLSTDRGASVIAYAPAGMGKSRLMQRLLEILKPKRIKAKSPFQLIQLDCGSDAGISNSTDKLLQAIYQKFPVQKALGGKATELWQGLSMQIMKLRNQKKRLIIMLDRIELMTEESLNFVRRRLLPELRSAVNDPAYYPSVIAFGRVHPRAWRGRDEVRFETVDLSPFRREVIEEILRRKTDELKLPRFPDSKYTQWAESILNITHGHPRCIVNLVSWLCEQLFAVPADFDRREIFFDFFVPVIQREILSEDNLAPLEKVGDKGKVARRLQQVLPYVCVFRFYSIAQLRILAHCELIDQDEIEVIEKQLSKTFLIDSPVQRAWFRPHEVIRRLLTDALHHQQPDVFVKINQAACKFYDAWITHSAKGKTPNLLGGTLLQGNDQVYHMVEGLYHHSMARKPRQSIKHLKKILTNYLLHLRGAQPVKTLTQLLANLMLDDGELERAVCRYGKPQDYRALVSLVENWKG